MTKLFPKHRPKRKPKLLSREVVKNDPEEYGKKHIRAIQNPDGWYR